MKLRLGNDRYTMHKRTKNFLRQHFCFHFHPFYPLCESPQIYHGKIGFVFCDTYVVLKMQQNITGKDLKSFRGVLLRADLLDTVKNSLFHNKNRTNSETFLFYHEVTFLQLFSPASSIFQTCSFPQKTFAIQSKRKRRIEQIVKIRFQRKDPVLS